MTKAQQPRIQKPDINQKYEEYLVTNGEPKNKLSNPLNLFDKFNLEDKLWFKAAESYISQGFWHNR